MPTEGESTHVKPSAAASQATSRGRVLVVEDDRPLLEAFADALMDARFEVGAASDGPSALRALEQSAYDVVLTDVVMPGATGVDVLRAVRERDLDVPVVLVTGSPSVETAVQALELGALHYLVKPVSAAELVRSVEDAARLRRLARVKRDALRYLGHEDGLVGDRAGLDAAFGRALGSFHLAFQPIIRSRDGSVFAWEALLRTRERTVSGPLAFFEMAERLGRVRELSRAIRAAVAQTAKRTRGVMFFVNLHPDDLLDEALFDPASPLSGLASEVVYEFTERSSIDGIPDVRERAKRLRALGFRLAIDDLGSGYAGLTSFASLQPDFVKLDRGLVHGLDQEPVKRRLVGSVASIAREMGCSVVAEGIETAAERDAARDLGCALMQGYFFRRPEELSGESTFDVLAGG